MLKTQRSSGTEEMIFILYWGEGCE